MGKPVHTAVIPAAGLGTRFLPITSVVPKEMLPVLDLPMIHHIAQEALESGIEHIVIVTSGDKPTLRQYFSRALAKEQVPHEKGESELAFEIQHLSEMAYFTFVIQDKPRGLGDAILQAKEAVDMQPFAVLLPDDVILSEEPTLSSMLKAREMHQGSYVAVEEISSEQIPSYGVVGGKFIGSHIYQVDVVIEKPPLKLAPSNLGIVGRYILEPEIFGCLEETRPGALGEIQLTDAISLLLKKQPVNAYLLQGTRLDCGNPMGLLRASLELALRREDTAEQVKAWLKELII